MYTAGQAKATLGVSQQNKSPKISAARNASAAGTTPDAPETGLGAGASAAAAFPAMEAAMATASSTAAMTLAFKDSIFLTLSDAKIESLRLEAASEVA